MPEKQIEKIDTGMKDLDEDLSELFRIFSGNALSAAKAVLDNQSVSIEAFQRAFPPRAARIAFALANEDNFKEFILASPAKARPVLERARKLVVEHFSAIRNHPAVEKLFSKFLEEHVPPNSIVGVQSELFWGGRSPTLEPRSKTRFVGFGEKLLLESTLDPDDLIFLVSALAEVFEEQLEEIEKLGNHVYIRGKSKIAHRIGLLEGRIKSIKERAARLNIEVKSDAVRPIAKPS